ncbi:hypothetical protein [Armatimonas rosea]|uniref:Uncharacterized protein n=1 Tax=Armatimonas rosea TaxID=685828 RepID=A0A7W9SWE6_ARMRO|nr:hypothetical protein [Armatimonas rosea]MBB6053218.1 hypothetical protein [Armatimonas rosea]
MMKSNCDYCGCPFRFKVTTMSPSLAPRALWSKLAHGPESAAAALRAEIQSYGYRTSWHLSYTCTGCGMIGTWGEEYTQDDAERWVAEKNALLETPEARYAADHWEVEVDRRQGVAKLRFLELFAARFPVLHSQIRPSKLREETLASFRKLKISLELGIQPKTPPPFEWTLSVQLMPNEAILFFKDWHGHYRHRESPEYLQEVIDSIEHMMASDFQESCHCFLWQEG